MRTTKLGLLGFTALSAIAFSSAAHATDETGDASASIVSPIVITETTSMDFASIIADAAGDTVTLTPLSGISSTGASTFSGTTTAALFDVTGDGNAAVTIAFSTGDVLSGAGTDMPLGNFAHNAGGSPAFDASGDLQFSVGADLTVGASQTAGAYTGTYTLSVDYP